MTGPRRVVQNPIKVQRPFGWPVDDVVDAFAVVGLNGSISKLDLYLHREVVYDVEIDDDGFLHGTVTVVLESDVPDDAPPLTLGKTDEDGGDPSGGDQSSDGWLLEKDISDFSEAPFVDVHAVPLCVGL